MVVYAALFAVHCQRADWSAEEGQVVESAIEVFGLERPARHEHPFHACTRGPAVLSVIVVEGETKRAGAELGIRQGEATGAVEQNLFERYAGATAHRGQAINFCRGGDKRR